MSEGLRLSADGLFYWDGRRWVSALSPDGAHRWDGAGWVPLRPRFQPPVYAPQPVFTPAPTAPPRARPIRVRTSSTGPLQFATAAFYALIGGWWVVLTAVAAINVPGAVNRFIAYEEALHPDQPLPPPGYDTSLDGTIYFFLGAGALLAVGAAITIVVGAMRRWAWMHYAVLVALCLQVLVLPLALADVLGFENAQASLDVGAPLRWGMVAFGVVAIPLLAWMGVALLKRGPWAMRGYLPDQQ